MADWSVLRLAVMGLIICGLVTIFGVTFLLFEGKSAPDGLFAIGGTSVGALATMLVSVSHRDDREPTRRTDN